MYHIIDEQKVKAHLFNKIVRGKTKNTEYLDLKNIRYFFDENLELEGISLLDKRENAYVLTTDGFVQFRPSYVIAIPDLFDFKDQLANPNHIRKGKFKAEKYKDYPLNLIDPCFSICSDYICFEYPTYAKQLTEDMIVIESIYPKPKVEQNAKVYSTEEEWIFDFRNANMPVFLGVNTEKKLYRLCYVSKVVYKMIIKRGVCWMFDGSGETICL